jgi:hypothetical protein
VAGPAGSLKWDNRNDAKGCKSRVAPGPKSWRVWNAMIQILIRLAVIVWRASPGHRTATVLNGATVAWAEFSGLVWQIRKRAQIPG